MYVCSYNKLSCGTATVLVPSGGTPQEISTTIKSHSWNVKEKQNCLNIENIQMHSKLEKKQKINLQKWHSLLQVGRVVKDQEPSDRHWVVSESLVSYPVKQL